MISDIIDSWAKEVVKMLPPVMRGVSYIDYLASLVQPIQYKTDELISQEQELEIRLKYQGQIMVLAASLNEINSITVAPFIRIETNRDAAATPTYVYAESDGIPTWTIQQSPTPTDYITPDPKQSNTIPDFRVLIPSTLWTQTLEDTVRADTQLYKIAGKLFEIKQYTP